MRQQIFAHLDWHRCRVAAKGLCIALTCSSLCLARDREVARTTRTAQSRFIHRIRLYDSEGNLITAKSVAPYSPRRTCGSTRCHDYETISRGTHSQMFPSSAFDAHRAPPHVWTVFDHTTGVQAPLAYGFMPPKRGPFNPSVHISAFEFVTKFGAFHPGGGRLEFDGQGKRYDKCLAEDETLRSKHSPDYFRARWDQSGVLENDCMVCHARSLYDHAERAKQIGVMNFEWAPTAGMGFGAIKGQVSTTPRRAFAKAKTPQEPAVKVIYNPTIFDADGRVCLSIGKPPDRNCLFCHRRPVKADVSWRDSVESDIHSRAGLACVDCHRCGLNHVMPLERGLRSTLSCRGCHAVGRLGAPKPKHRGFLGLHLDKMSCEVCHSGPRPRAVPFALEQPTDPFWGLILGATKPSGPTVWAPIFAKDNSGQLQTFVRLLPAWYARETKNGFQPIKPRALVPIFFRNRRAIKDDNNDGIPDVNTDAEIATMLSALAARGGQPVYFAGGKKYSLNAQGKLRSEPSPLANPIDHVLAHNVRPASRALGASGCGDCHSAKSPFARSIDIQSPMGPGAQPVGNPLMERLRWAPAVTPR